MNSAAGSLSSWLPTVLPITSPLSVLLRFIMTKLRQISSVKLLNILILLLGFLIFFFPVNISAFVERWLHVIIIFGGGGRSLSDPAAKRSHLMIMKEKSERKQWEEKKEVLKSVCLKVKYLRDKVWIVLSCFRLVLRAFVSLVLVHKAASQQLLMTWKTGHSKEHSDPIRVLKASRAVWCPLMHRIYLQTI